MRVGIGPSDRLTGRLSTAVAWVTLGMGAALTLAPRRSAALLCWTDREAVSRLVGAADLVLGVGLMLDRRRARWMLARALLNVVIGLVYVHTLAEGGPRRRGAAVGTGMMAALAVFDYSLSRRLRGTETP